MKRFFYLLVYGLSLGASAQVPIASRPVHLTWNKTTTLIFPYSIKRVNIGSRDVAGQIMPEADSIIQLKAARKDFSETSLTVVTAEGKFYSFLLSYEQDQQ